MVVTIALGGFTALRRPLKIIVVAVLGCLLLSPLYIRNACAQESSPSTNPPPSTLTQDIQEQINRIAEEITREANGLLFVPYAEAPPHFGPGDKEHFGVHYNIFLVKRFDLVTDDDRVRINYLAAKLVRLTTEIVLKPRPSFSHMGIQVFGPRTWSFGGHQRGYVSIYEFAKDDLISVAEDASPSEWLSKAYRIRAVVVPVSDQ